MSRAAEFVRRHRVDFVRRSRRRSRVVGGQTLAKTWVSLSVTAARQTSRGRHRQPHAALLSAILSFATSTRTRSRRGSCRRWTCLLDGSPARRDLGAGVHIANLRTQYAARLGPRRTPPWYSPAFPCWINFSSRASREEVVKYLRAASRGRRTAPSAFFSYLENATTQAPWVVSRASASLYPILRKIERKHENCITSSTPSAATALSTHRSSQSHGYPGQPLCWTTTAFRPR